MQHKVTTFGELKISFGAKDFRCGAKVGEMVWC